VPRRLVRTGRQQPFEVLMLAFSVAAGAAFAAGARPPGSLERSLPAAVLTAWYGALLASGLVGLAGCYWRWDVVTGLLLERAAMLTAAAAGLVYVTGLFTVGGWAATGAGLYVGAYLVASLVRARHITVDLRLLEGGVP
jgi:hypothetical protein